MIYIIIVQPEYGMPRVSREAFSSLADSQRFIESLYDTEEKLTDYRYRGRQAEYVIQELILR